MKLVNKISQHRRDCVIELKCEGCNSVVIDKYAYDDRNYWDNVIPARKCKDCGKSTKDMGLDIEQVPTKYSSDEVI